MIVLVAAGETHRWYGNFGFVRIWQGKSIQLFVFTPLVYAYAIEFALRPTVSRWGLLAGAQIAALGSSSAALWAAPAAAGIALCSALPPTRRGARLFAIGLLASAYVLGAGWVAKGWMEQDTASQQPVYSQQEIREREQIDLELDRPGVRLEQALALVLGDARLRRVAVACVLIAWAASASALARRFALVAPLAVALVLLHPTASSWVAANATGESFWRSLWAFPVPILMALAGIAPLQIGAAWRRRWVGPAAWVLLLGGFALLAPGKRGPSLENRVRLGWPSLKVEPVAYAWAAELSASVPSGSVVAAPSDVGVWLPTFHRACLPAPGPRALPGALSGAARRPGDRPAPLDDGHRGGRDLRARRRTALPRRSRAIRGEGRVPARHPERRADTRGPALAGLSTQPPATRSRDLGEVVTARARRAAARRDIIRSGTWNPRELAQNRSRSRAARAFACWCRSPRSTRRRRWPP